MVFLNFNFVIISNSEKNGKNIIKNIHTFFTQIYQLLTFYTYFSTYYHFVSNILTHIHTPEHFWPSFTLSHIVFLSGLSKIKLPMLFLALPTWGLKQGFLSSKRIHSFTKILNSGIFRARSHFINTLYINHVRKLHIELCIGTYYYNVDKILKSWVYTDFFVLFLKFISCIYYYYFYFTILYWFCPTSTWICHGYTCVPHPEPPSHLPPCTIPLGHPSAPAPSILYPASNLDWWFISYMILYMF